MRNPGIGERGEHPGLPPHGVVAVRAGMPGRPAQDELTPAPAKPEENVLRATLQRCNILDRPALDLPIIHPARQRGEIDRLISRRCHVKPIRILNSDLLT
jgi:hypothetical protein